MSEHGRLGMSVVAILTALFMALTVYSPASGSLSLAYENQPCLHAVSANVWNPICVISEFLPAAASYKNPSLAGCHQLFS